MTDREIKDALLKMIGLGRRPIGFTITQLESGAFHFGIDPHKISIGVYIKQLIKDKEIESLFSPIYCDCGTRWIEHFFLLGCAEVFLGNLQEAFNKSPASYNYQSPVKDWRRSNPNEVTAKKCTRLN